MTQPQTYTDPATGQSFVAVNGQWVPAGPPQPPAQSTQYVQYAQPAPTAPPMAQPQYAQAPMGYPAQVFPGMPGQPQAYGMPAGVPQQAAPPLAKGSLEDFYGQPSSGGGKSISWKDPATKMDKPVGTEYLMLVTRAITAADVEQQTEMGSNRPAFFKDGRPKFVLKVPVRIAPSPEYPDGVARWFVQGAVRDDLTRAMTEAGVPLDTEGRPQPPEQGAVIHVVLTGFRPVPNMSPAKQFKVRYWRPSDPYAQQVAQFLGSAPVQAPAAVQQYAQPQQYAPQYAAPQQPAAPQMPQPPAPSAPQPPAPQAAPQAAQPPQPPAPPVPQPPAPAQQQPTGPAQQASWPAAPGVPQLDEAGQAVLAQLLAGTVPQSPPAG